MKSVVQTDPDRCFYNYNAKISTTNRSEGSAGLLIPKASIAAVTQQITALLNMMTNSLCARLKQGKIKTRQSRRPLLALMLPGFFLATLSGCGINNIPTFDEAVNGAWSEIQNQYKRRADLIPSVVETVKAYADQEEDVLLAVTEARTRVSQMNVTPETLTDPGAFKQFQENQSTLSSALSRLLVVVESYPELKSNENFLTLQAQLEGTENRIAVARRDYIQKVQRYNTELRTIPGRWWRKFMYPDSRLKENFSVEEDLSMPEIKLD